MAETITTGGGSEGQRPTGEELRHQRHESRTGSTYKAFLKELCKAGNWQEDFAENAAVSVLCHLEQRIMADEAKDMNAQLPFKLQELLKTCKLHEGRKVDKFGRDELYKRVADDLGLDAGKSEQIVRAVFTCVRGHLSEGEAEDVANQLPKDLEELWRRPS